MTPKTFVFIQKLLPKRLITLLAHILGQVSQPKIKNFLINRFIEHFDIDMSSAAKELPADYKNFNEFFTRKLKPNVRPLSLGDNTIVCPVDGKISEIGRIETSHIFQAKSKYYLLDDLLSNDQQMIPRYQNGRFATIYLAPKDYHRVHMPIGGLLERSIYVPGRFFSVNEATTIHLNNLFAKNERLICEFSFTHQHKTSSMLMIMVGALIVSGIETTWGGVIGHPFRIRIEGQKHNPIFIDKGQEMGRFNLGSTVILIFPDKTMRWADSLKPGSLVQMGRKIGNFNRNGF